MTKATFKHVTPFGRSSSHPTEGAEAAVYWHDDAVYESGGGAAEPDEGRGELVGLAEAGCGGVLDDLLSPFGGTPVLVYEHHPVLLPEEETGCYGVDPETWTVAARELDG